MKHFWIFLSVTLLFAGCNPQKKYNHSAKLIDRTRVFGKVPVELYEFPNGLKVVVSENKKAPVFSYHITYLAGSGTEPRGKTGISSIIGRIMYRGDKAFRKYGADSTVYSTGLDQSEHIVSLPLSHLEEIIRQDADNMKELKFDDNIMEEEKAYLLKEDRQLINDLKQLVFLRHPYRNPVPGYENDIKNLNAESIQQYHKALYAPNNTLIFVAGDVKANHVLSLIDKYMGDLQSTELTDKAQTEEPQFSERTKTIWLDIKKIRMMMGYHIPAADHADMAAIELLDLILSAGDLSRLPAQLMAPGMASVSSYYYAAKDPSFYCIDMTVLKSGAWKETVSIIDSIFDDIRKNGISDEEMERALNFAKLRNYSILESNDSIISSARSILLTGGKLEDINEKWDRMRKIGSENIQQVTAKYFNRNNRSVVMAFPKR